MDNVKVMEKFQKFRPPYFNGIAQDPLAPTKGIEGMDETFEVLTLTGEQKLLCTNYQLQNEERKEIDFMDLKQGSKSMLEYQQEFEKLFFFALEHLKEDHAKAKRFKKGLRPTIGAMLVGQYLHSYAQVVQAAKSIEDEQRENYQAL
ncbi:uncharacterized protein LOC122071923 [Macadamia integrifolia]|uniref:uncharacterized protein LOC122071923 n=1 Tax=Macadamia integrifolia TaxID=60698 RepID=UPI001C4E5830|nr:uncharacterized protein LOC122071923 [Macadamia integrifolia]